MADIFAGNSYDEDDKDGPPIYVSRNYDTGQNVGKLGLNFFHVACDSPVLGKKDETAISVFSIDHQTFKEKISEAFSPHHPQASKHNEPLIGRSMGVIKPNGSLEVAHTTQKARELFNRYANPSSDIKGAAPDNPVMQQNLRTHAMNLCFPQS